MKPASYFDILTKEATSGFASLAPACRFYLLLSCLFAQIEKCISPTAAFILVCARRGEKNVVHATQQSSFAFRRLIPPITVSTSSLWNVLNKLSLLISKSFPDPLNAWCKAEIGSFIALFICTIIIIPLWSWTLRKGWMRFGGGSGWDAITRPSCVCGEMDIAPFFLSLSLSHLHWTFVRLDRHSWFFQGLSSHKGFSVRIAVSPFFPTITMLDHHYTNGGALAFQGASIKEGKKSCSRRGEIHFVPGSNICCSRPSQKDARIKPEEPSDLL